MGLVDLLFSFKGRINRLQYWMGSLGLGVAFGFALVLLFVTAGPGQAASKDAAPSGALGMVLLMVLMWGVVSWSAMAIQVKRFHDRGQSGFWSLLPLLPLLGMFVSGGGAVVATQDPMQVAAAIQPYMFVMWAINFGFFINLGCLPGADGPNKYGDGPGSASAPSAPSPRKDAAQSPAAAIFGSAEQAMERAIAERSRPQPAQQRPAMAGAAPSAARAAAPAPASAGAGAKPASFGRRVTR